VGVVNPEAAPHRYGVFEDNNPWPIAGTEDKESAQIDAWLTSNEATLKTGAGKYGVYVRYDEAHDGEDIEFTITSIVVTPTPVTVKAGDSLQFTATVLGTGNPPQTVNWEVTAQYQTGSTYVGGPPLFGTTITTGGLLEVSMAEAASYDQTTLSVHAWSRYAGHIYAGIAAVTIPATVRSVSLNKSVMAIAVNGEETLTATVTPATAANRAVTWSSSNAAVAYGSQSGKVIGMAPGAAFIEVWTVEGNKTYTCKVTVSAPIVPPTPVDQFDLSASIGTPATADPPRPLNGVSFENAQYSGIVTWSHSNTAHTGVLLDDFNGGFWSSTVYTATVALTAKAGYTFANAAFTHSGGAVSQSANTGGAVTVTIVFPPTADGTGSTGG
jgi:hypothetical protein